MACCVLIAGILALMGRFVRRVTGRGDAPPPRKRLPGPTRVVVAADESDRPLVGADV
jgi:hypothetical protein